MPVSVKIEADISGNTFDVYINGELAAEDFAFRTDSTELTSVKAGSSARDADLRIYEIKVYGE